MTSKTRNNKPAPAPSTKARGEADKAKECTFPRDVLETLLRADGAAEDAGLAALRAGIAHKLTPAAYMDTARGIGRAVTLQSAKVRASEINAAGGVAKTWGAKAADAIIAAGCKLPGHKVRNALSALRVAKECGKVATMAENFPTGYQQRMALFAREWKAEQEAAEALKAKRAEALRAGKGQKVAQEGDEPHGAEGNRFPEGAAVVSIEDARARLVTLRATADAIGRELAALPAAAFASKKARTYALEGAKTFADLLGDCLPKG